MNTQNTSGKFSLPVVPVSFLALVIVCALLFWWLRPHVSGGTQPASNGPVGIGRLEPFRTPGGTLHTNGIVKTEELRKDEGSWRGTTSSGIRLDATYRYEIELRSNWNFYIDDTRKTALIVAPLYKPQLPVAVDSKTVQEWTSSGWGRFDKWDQLQALRQEISPFLAAKARSKSYMDLARGDARKTVEEFASDWLLKSQRIATQIHVPREGLFLRRIRHPVSSKHDHQRFSAMTATPDPQGRARLATSPLRTGFDHWITSSARDSRVCGTTTPSAIAVLRLIPSSN